MKIFLNPYYQSKWKRVKKDICQFEIEEILSPAQVSDAVANGEKVFIAVGGDGTINLLLNTIMKLSDNSGLIIGAVGLGSSNDFHKPFRQEAVIKGIPVRIDIEKAFFCDVIRVDYQDMNGEQKICFCLVNASIGLTASANAIFNLRLKVITTLQKISLEAAIIASALKAIFSYRNIPCQLIVDELESFQSSVTNLGIIKNPHFAGSLCYDTSVEPDDGEFGINLCEDMSILERVKILFALYRHRFYGLPKTKSWKATRLFINAHQPFALEMDGEVVWVKKAEFSLIPKAVRCCR